MYRELFYKLPGGNSGLAKNPNELAYKIVGAGSIRAVERRRRYPKLIFLMILFGIATAAQVAAGGRFERREFYGVNSIEVEGALLDFRIVGRPGIVTEVRPGELRSNIRLEAIQRGDRLVVTVERRFTLIKTGDNQPVEIRAPRSTVLKVANASGNFAISNFDADELHARSVSGDLTLDSCRGEMILGTVSGDLQFHDGEGSLAASSVSGDILIDRFAGTIDVRSTSGDLELGNIRGSISAKTTSGDVDVEDIWVTGDCIFVSTSGSVDVQFSNPRDSLRFDLVSTSGDLSVFGVRGKRALAIGDGRYTISGKTISGDQGYR